MGGFIFFLICAIGLFLFARWIGKKDTRESYETDGVIERKIHEDHGYVRFYVRCTIHGQQVCKQTETYRDGTADIHVGDAVKIAYCCRANGEPDTLVRLVDDNIPSTSDAGMARGIYAVAVVCILIAIVLLVKSFIN